MRVATIRGRLLFLSQSSMCGYYSRAATNRGAASIRINTVYNRTDPRVWCWIVLHSRLPLALGVPRLSLHYEAWVLLRCTAISIKSIRLIVLSSVYREWLWWGCVFFYISYHLSCESGHSCEASDTPLTLGQFLSKWLRLPQLKHPLVLVGTLASRLRHCLTYPLNPVKYQRSGKYLLLSQYQKVTTQVNPVTTGLYCSYLFLVSFWKDMHKIIYKHLESTVPLAL